MFLFIVIQFLQPRRNRSSHILLTDITSMISMPGNVLTVLKASCYDCHSNNTNYPWYSRIQPFGWLLARHIRNGKAQLNFSEFGSYTPRRQLSKLKEIGISIKNKTMPLKSYTMMHYKAKLSKENEALIVDWVTKLRDSLALKN